MPHSRNAEVGMVSSRRRRSRRSSRTCWRSRGGLSRSSTLVCRAAVTLVQPEAHHGDIEQVTGLLHRDAFYRGVATLLASRSRSDDQYLVMVAVNIDSFSLLMGGILWIMFAISFFCLSCHCLLMMARFLAVSFSTLIEDYV